MPPHLVSFHHKLKARISNMQKISVIIKQREWNWVEYTLLKSAINDIVIGMLDWNFVGNNRRPPPAYLEVHIGRGNQTTSNYLKSITSNGLNLYGVKETYITWFRY